MAQGYLLVTKELRRCTKTCLKQLKEQGRDEVFFVFPEMKKSASTTSLVLKTPKTESSVRTIYLPKTVINILRQTKNDQDDLKKNLPESYQDFNLVVAQKNGRPFEEHTIENKLTKMIAAHHLKPVVFHSLRHSSTSVKLKISGGDIKTVQKDTGHSQARMVTDVYSHSFNEDRKHLARKMDTEFFRKGIEDTPPVKPMNDSLSKLMDVLQASPEKAGSLMMLLGIA